MKGKNELHFTSCDCHSGRRVLSGDDFLKAESNSDSSSFKHYMELFTRKLAFMGVINYNKRNGVLLVLLLLPHRRAVTR